MKTSASFAGAVAVAFSTMTVAEAQQPPLGPAPPVPLDWRPPHASPPPYVQPNSWAIAPPPGVAHAGKRPETLPYEDGERIPPGYHLHTTVRLNLIVGGTSTFFATYGLTCVVGYGFSEEPGVAPVFIPIAGPFVALWTLDRPDVWGPGLVVSGVGQSVGVALIIAGLAAPKTQLARNEFARRPYRLMPSFGPSGGALVLAGEL